MDFENISSEDSKSPPTESTANATDLIADVAKMFDDQILTDVTITVNGEVFKAHSFILAARSKVFRAMFQNQMKEKDQGVIVIRDIESHIIGSMLQFMYKGKTENLTRYRIGLLEAAEKYDLERLKEMCLKRIETKLSVENVIDTLILAHKYNIVNLKKTTMEFIDCNYGAVRRRDEWIHIKSDTDLLQEMMDVMKNISPQTKRPRK